MRSFQSSDVNAIVIDIGSKSTKIGYAGADVPLYEIDSVTGISTQNEITNYSFGDSHLKYKDSKQEISCFVKDGFISDFKIFEEFLDHVFKNILRTESDQHPLLFTESPIEARTNKDQLSELAFERFNVPALQIVKQPVLSLFSQGRSSGLVVDIGHDCTTVTSIVDAYTVGRNSAYSYVAGNALLKCYKSFLNLSDDMLISNRLGKNAPQSLKEYIAMGTLQEMAYSTFQLHDQIVYDQSILEQMPRISCELPDKTILEIGEERAPECLFDTSKAIDTYKASCSVTSLICSCTKLCDIDLRTQMYSNILLVGGGSLITGIQERLNSELSVRLPQSTKLRIFCPPSSSDRRYSSFIGGSILASMNNFYSRWISKHEFTEHGSSIVYKKCNY